jgi:long-chain fatty acid transport protein
VVLVLVFAAPLARAEGGYYAGALGAVAAGRAGAFTAKADDLTAVAYNPAGLAKIRGTIFQIGNRISYNASSYTRAATLDWGNPMGGVAPMVSFAEVRNSTPWQAAEPLLGVASDLGLRDWGFALAAYAPPGISRLTFPDEGGQNYQMISREAIILNYTASAAWKLRDVFGVGASLQWIHVPRLIYSLMINGNGMPGAANPVASRLDIRATTSGSDLFTFNAILGAWVRPVPAFEIAVAGQVVPTDIVTSSTLSVAFKNTSEGELTLNRSDVRVSLPLPMLARVGARYRNLAADGRERFDIELNVAYETWSRVQRFSVDAEGIVASYGPSNVDLGRIDIQKRWRDTVAVSLGSDVAVVPGAFTLRGGVFYETAVADPAYANVDFAGGPQMGGALGASVHAGRWQLMIAYQARVQAQVSVTEANGRVYQQVPDSACDPPYTDATTCNPNYLGQPAPTINGGTYRAQSHFVLLAAQYRFGL